MLNTLLKVSTGFGLGFVAGNYSNQRGFKIHVNHHFKDIESYGHDFIYKKPSDKKTKSSSSEEGSQPS